MSKDKKVDDKGLELPVPTYAFPLRIEVKPDDSKLEKFIAENLQALTAIVSPLARQIAEQIMELDLSDDITRPSDWLDGVPNSFAEFLHADKRFLVEGELVKFYLQAYAMTLASTPGYAIHANLVARAAGMASAMKRARNVKRDFQVWAREQCRTRDLAKKGWKTLLVKEYLKEMRPEGMVTEAALKKYLTPSEGFRAD